MTTIRMRATYDTILWLSDEYGDYEESGGFTDPRNPWGGFKVELPYDFDPDLSWYDENVTYADFDDVEEAAEFVCDFPGGVWDLVHDCEESIDYRTGAVTRVTLHVEGPLAADVLKRAGDMMRERDEKLKAIRRNQ